MALSDYLNTEFAIMDRISSPDPMGGVIYTYQEGAHFRGGLVKNNTTEMQIAGQQGAKTVYTLVVSKSIDLDRGQIVHRLSDGDNFQCTSPTRDMTTPGTAVIQFSQATMERVEL